MPGTHPLIRPFARGRVLAPTGVEAMRLDEEAIRGRGVPQAVLMENAGRSAALIADRLCPGGSVLALVGSGNNGGDALVLLRTLAAWGRDVRGVLVSDRTDADGFLHGWSVRLDRDTDLDDRGWSDALAEADLIVDGLLGTGLSGPPRERQASAIRRVNGAGRPILALDVPSGVDAGTGAVPGLSIAAACTVAFGAPKVGTLLHPGRGRTGRLVAVEIGFPPSDEADVLAEIATPQWLRALLPQRALDTHKNAEGRVLVCAGQPGMAGAAVLAARAALAGGAGLVRVCSAPQNREIVQAAVPEAIYVDASDAGAIAEALSAVDAVALGPGLGTDAFAESVAAAIVTGPIRPTVLDADALNLVAAGTLDLPAVAAGRPVLITPHVGEMSGLLGISNAEVSMDRLAALGRAVDRFGCAVLLKGTPSLVGSAGSRVLIDTQSSSDLAVAGLGDALTGLCTALLARGVPPRESGALGLYLSGRAAQLADLGVSLTPSDVVSHLAKAMCEADSSHSDFRLPFVVFDADAAR